MKKKMFILILAISMILLFIIFLPNFNYKIKHSKKKYIKIGVFLYNADDLFISNLSNQIERYVKEVENSKNIKIKLEILNSGSDQVTQDRQIERCIALDYDILCVNPVERINVSKIIDLSSKKGLPLIFFNRRPATDDMNRYNKLYYVGTDPKAEAIKQGKMLVDLYMKDKNSLDLNGDGKIQYVLLEGEANHQDSLIRTKWTIKTLQDARLPINKLAGGVANWDKAVASALMCEFLDEYKDKIELVISNNDAMALGAIEAINIKKDKRGIKVVGIDGVSEAVEEIKKDEMYGTVSIEIENFAKTIIDMGLDLYFYDKLSDKIKDKLQDNKYYFIEQKAVNKETLIRN